MIRHLPNAITALRIAVTPWIGVLVVRGEWRNAFTLVLAAGLSDGLDGWLSRRFGWQSRLGAYLDPLADKALLATLFLALGWVGALPWWMVGLAFGRDLMILAFAAYGMAAKGIRSFPPSLWGKLSTALQLLLCGGAVLKGAWPENFLAGWVPAVLWASAAATAWSGVHYGLTGYRMLKKEAD